MKELRPALVSFVLLTALTGVAYPLLVTGIAQLAFPAQNAVTGKLRQASAKAGKPDFLALWAGQAAPLARALPAAELIARLEAETVDSIQQLKGMVHES